MKPIPGLGLERSLADWFPARFRRSIQSLRAQLIFWNVVALMLMLGGLGVVCRFVAFSFMMQSVDKELEHSVEMYRRPPRFGGPPFSGARRTPPGPDHRANDRGRDKPAVFGLNYLPPPRRPFRPPDAYSPYHTHFYDAQGQSAMPDERRPVWDADALIRALQGETLCTTVTMDGERVRVVSTFGFTPFGARGAVQKAYALKEIDRALAGVDTALLLLIPVGLLGAGWLGATLTDRVLKRVHRMTRAAAGFGAADFSRRLPVSGNDEFAELAETFNGLLGRLDRAFQEQKQLLQLQQRFTADASHELKTPLTIVRGRASLALGRTTTDERSRRAFREIANAATTMSQLVQDLLLLARSDEGQMGRDGKVFPIREVLESARAQALQEGGAPITLKVEPEELYVLGNEAELVRLFRNLLDNAVRYTPPEGRICVEACAANGDIMVTVEDTGVGIASEHLPHLGERFYRADASRTRPTGGTGLGLSICRSVVEAHNGTLNFRSTLNVGTVVTVTLPIYPFS